ncbi:uncharacterized protein HMPREF1541_00114 [Cyphellophora europaea CBS 101466]|uniref:aldehyde dehydrogenase (NAD(+)) n=1 Tax=Cyphellophora europaea (strain CBS 101466) TaxID=1220924 RepID=W2SB64_CYPE1|nr:uncharacterized protein HMPREF1541_00114 [Cyphellophora europaea CBS 101466]ETN45932.1 hypothetical protein HMPREF1541_00114 [Cyphellophora europaea CBS 101466]
MVNETIRTISPATQEVVVERLAATFQDAERMAKASSEAFKSWRKTPLSQRKDIVRKALTIVQARKEALGRELTTQMGRPIAYSVKEIETMQLRADYLLDIADDSLCDLPGRQENGFERWVQREAVGPTLIVFAWNFPFLIIVNALVPALLSGNSVVLKPSPQTPLIGERFVEIFAEAGLPANTLLCLHIGRPELLRQVVQQIPDFQLITFTGSTKVGIDLRKATAERVVPLNLELGGNDPAYVRPDADLAYVAAQLVDAAVFNAGQSCCAVERIYVHTDVHDAFVEALQRELATYRLGDPFDPATNIGPVVSPAAKNAIESQVEQALGMGAVDATPENDSFAAPPPKGNYVMPRILTNVTAEMDVLRQETFGPIMPVVRVSGDVEAVALMNDSHYGLTASVWTKDIGKGRELTAQLEAGTVFINRADYPAPDLAWTGWKSSGLGCTLGPKAFDAFVKLKSFHIRMQHG